MGQPQVDDHWKDRRFLAAALGVAIVCLPVAAAIGITIAMERVFPRPDQRLDLVLWWFGALALSTVVYLVSERVARRAVPLKVLLRMGLAFPHRAPRRLAVAWRAASVRDLDRRVAAAREHGIADEPTEAAEKIVTLAAAMSAHDRGTRGHSERVRALTDMISEELHLSAPDRDRLRWSALLHDIGKLAVHPEVLNKPGTLDDEEWAVVRLHPLEGAKLTKPLAGWLGPWSRTMAEHHERFDGKGYPAGLSGEDISFGGRIVAVADSYDVMTAARSYKKPVGPEAARKELAASAGSQFDPEVVRAFLAVSVWRLRIAAPLAWLGAAGWGRLGGLVRVGTATGQTVVTGLLAAGGVVGVTLAAPASQLAPVAAGRPGTVALTAPAPGTTTAPRVSTGSSPTTTTGGPGTTVGSSTSTSTDPGGGTPSSSTAPGGSSTTTTASSPPGPGSSSATTTTTLPGSTTTTTLPGSTTTTTTPPGSTTTTTTPTTTTTTTTPTTTTVPGPAAPAPPTALQAVPGCQLILPEIALQWTASATGPVTSYEVLRDNSPLATVRPGTTHYTDTSVGLLSTYSYEVEAIGPGGTATSAPTSATTPLLCVNL